MDRDMAEIDVQQPRSVAIEHLHQTHGFAPGNHPRRIAELTKPNTPQGSRRRLGTNCQLLERKLIRVLSLLRDDDRPDTAERRDLPIDVEHLRLEKCRAIRGDYRTLSCVARAVSRAGQNRRPNRMMPFVGKSFPSNPKRFAPLSF